MEAVVHSTCTQLAKYTAEQGFQGAHFAITQHLQKWALIFF